MIDPSLVGNVEAVWMSLYSVVLGKIVPKTLIAYMNILKGRIGSDSDHMEVSIYYLYFLYGSWKRRVIARLILEEIIDESQT